MNKGDYGFISVILFIVITCLAIFSVNVSLELRNVKESFNNTLSKGFVAISGLNLSCRKKGLFSKEVVLSDK